VIREIAHKKNIAYNFHTCALAEVSNENLRFFEAATTNGAINLTSKEIEQHKLLFYSFFVPVNLDEIEYLKLYYRQIQNDTSNLYLTILTTLACNFNCYYCYENKTGEFLIDEVKQGILKFVSERVATLKGIVIHWYGGEPLLFGNQICTISKWLKKVADEHGILYRSMLVSNCYLLNTEIADKLFEAGVNELQVTYDGPRKYHDKIRNDKGRPSFDVITGNIKYALERWKVCIRVNVSRENLHLIPRLIEQLAEAGLNDGGIIDFAPIHANGLGCSNLADSKSEKLILTSEFHTYCLEFIKIAFNLGFKVRLPLSAHRICSAVVDGGIVIEPNGFTKKCCNDVSDKTKNFGILSSSGLKIIQNDNLDIWLNYNPFLNKDCLECQVLPCCFGGCPWEAMRNSPLEYRCHPLKNRYGDYIDLLCEWVSNGAEYNPEDHTIGLKRVRRNIVCGN
jgi:uncharacterized protein